jgi:hypothetical protein
VTLIRTGVGDCEQCEFVEVTIGAKDANDLIAAGTAVLLPCTVCGVRALEAMDSTEHTRDENEKAFAKYVADGSLLLYHWSPVARRPSILRYGLRPCMRPTTHAGDGTQTWRAGYVCFADTPSWAWALSGKFRSAPAGDWDLWSCYLDRLTEPRILPADWANGIHEVRTQHRVFKRDLWHVGTRTKP